MEKHAYLIMAHNEFDIFEKLILLLDDERNDFYIHIDKKVNHFNFGYYKKLVKKSNVFYIDRLDVRWGDFSLVQCELNLLKAAINGCYRYYHLLSGVDLPLKTNDEIHYFFQKHDGFEFIHFCPEEEVKKIENRVSRYHFMRLFNNKTKYIYKMICFLQVIFQIKKKWDKNISLQYGAQWFSITHELAEYVISKENWIKEKFRLSSCADELFLQTVVYNSEFRDNLYCKKMNGDYSGCMRLIDWKRGNPYVFRQEDYEELINTDRLFARKFSTKVDEKIINSIFLHLKR